MSFKKFTIQDISSNIVCVVENELIVSLSYTCIRRKENPQTEKEKPILEQKATKQKKTLLLGDLTIII
jgi:hypothetical protein